MPLCLSRSFVAFLMSRFLSLPRSPANLLLELHLVVLDACMSLDPPSAVDDARTDTHMFWSCAFIGVVIAVRTCTFRGFPGLCERGFRGFPGVSGGFRGFPRLDKLCGPSKNSGKPTYRAVAERVSSGRAAPYYNTRRRDWHLLHQGGLQIVPLRAVLKSLTPPSTLEFHQPHTFPCRSLF